MKLKFIHILSSILLFLATNPVIAQRRNLEDPGDDPDAVPIDDYLWVLVLVGVVFAIIKLKAYAKQTKPSLK